MLKFPVAVEVHSDEVFVPYPVVRRIEVDEDELKGRSEGIGAEEESKP